MFRSWTETAEAIVMDKRPARSLREIVAADLAQALAPLDDAARAGASTPVPVDMGGGNPPGGKILAMTLPARSPTVQAYVEAYRRNKVAELSQEQMEAISEILVDAAKTGASPQEMARSIKQTVGLTANQAQQVMNYRRELEAGSAAALDRQLRDRRYDSLITREIDGGAPLTHDEIDRMVDAYHRRYVAYRAATIARTEGVGAANNGQAAAIQEILDQNPGMTVIKTWMAHLDERTRPDHRAMHGQEVIGFDAPFRAPDGTEILWPHHQDAPAKMVCNCRCTWSTKLVPRDTATRFLSDRPTVPAEVST